MRTLHLTERGLRGLRNDTQMSPQHRLVLEIVKRCPDIEKQNLTALFGELVAHYGDIDRAIVAVKAGQAGFSCPLQQQRSR